MKALLSPRWLWFGVTYAVAVMVLAYVAHVGDGGLNAFYMLLMVTLPASVVMYLPIYLAAAWADSIFSPGLDGSIASWVVIIGGFGATAALNVFVVRVAVQRVIGFRLARRP